MTKKDIYDKKIAPLLEEAMKICDEHDIPLISSCQLDEDRAAAKEMNHVNSQFVFAVPDDTTTMSYRFQAAMDLLAPRPTDPTVLN